MIWKYISIHLHRINNTGTWRSAVCCPQFIGKMRKEFPSEQLGFHAPSASADSVRLFGSSDQNYIRWQVSRPGWATQAHASTPFEGWVGPPAARSPFWQFLVIGRFSIRLSINSSGKIRKTYQILFLKHSLCFPDPSWACIATGFGSKFCGEQL